MLKHLDLKEDPIVLQDVSIRFLLPGERFRTFKDFAIRMLQGKVRFRHHWALRGVSFSVGRGEVLGFIGHNGAGKSTLLRVVARILKPTEGRIIVRGNVSPLLGVGAGFHPELTGRENIFLNGAVLGFSRHEMEEKFDRIVDFAELGEFIDAPLRTYSSGMRVRLGFAVATDTQPDILLIDEVLSVGDSSFREKSAARMQGFFEQGTTILLVSHSLNTIEEMCSRVAWIHQGTLRDIGKTEDIVKAYRVERRQLNIKVKDS